MKPTLQKTGFGYLEYDGQRVKKDILIRPSGAVEKRQKQLSKAVYGTSHTISLAEAEQIYQPEAEGLLIGSGQFDRVRLSPEAEKFFLSRSLPVEILSTPEAVQRWNKLEGKWLGLFHLTC
jgi:hypothetical protein